MGTLLLRSTHFFHSIFWAIFFLWDFDEKLLMKRNFLIKMIYLRWILTREAFGNIVNTYAFPRFFCFYFRAKILKYDDCVGCIIILPKQWFIFEVKICSRKINKSFFYFFSGFLWFARLSHQISMTPFFRRVVTKFDP